MKKKLLVVLPLLAAVIFAGCGTQTTTTTTTDAPAGMQVYETKVFSVQYPATREYMEDAYGALVMFFSPQDEGDMFRENVGIISEELPSEMTVEDYYQAIKSQLLTMVLDYNEISIEDITVNGVAAKKVVYEGTQEEYKLKWMQVYLVKDQVAYIVNYTATPDTFDQFITEVDAIANSFTLK